VTREQHQRLAATVLELHAMAGSVEQSELMRFESLRLWREQTAVNLRRLARELERLRTELENS